MKRFLVLVIVVGCGGGGGGVSIEQLPVELAKTQCSKLSECCTADELKQEALGADTEAKCEQVISAFATLGFGAINDSVHTGRVVYHGDKMRACLDAQIAASCVAFGASVGDPTACQGVFEPKVAAGGRCGNDIDCVTAHCSGDMIDFSGNITYGTCIDGPTAGMPCDQDECAAGLVCDHNSMCAATLVDGASCTSSSDCASNGCNLDDQGNATCGPRTTCNGQ